MHSKKGLQRVNSGSFQGFVLGGVGVRVWRVPGGRAVLVDHREPGPVVNLSEIPNVNCQVVSR